jgi:hypothetical protein
MGTAVDRVVREEQGIRAAVLLRAHLLEAELKAVSDRAF